MYAGRLCRLGSLLGQTPEAQECDDHAEDEQGDGKGKLQEVAGGGRADQGDDLLDQRGEGDAEHDDHGDPQHPALAVGLLQIHGAGDEGQGAEQLVGAAEEGPDVLVAQLGEDVGQHQGDDRRKILVGQHPAPGLHLVLLDGGVQEQLLEGQASHAGHGVQRGQGEGGDRQVDEGEDEFTVTIRTDEEATNGLYTVTYDPEILELVSTEGLTKYNAINDMTTGEVKAGFINEEALDADTGVADLVFRILDPEVRTTITVTTGEENDAESGETDEIVIGPETPVEVSYKVSSGDNSTWTQGSDESLNFRVTRTPNDYLAEKHFEEILLDGKPLDPSNYTKAPGAINITLKPEFLATLKPGKHTLTFVFDDGKIETTFTIEKAAPNTSDHNNAGTWAIMMIAAALAAFAAYRRRFTGRTDS